jgi:glycosyltransferase involved in cell wall biosynthesis
MNTPKVSVVMSVFNGERFLREAVESILEQSYRSFEFIIIDDGSTDGTAQILEEFAQKDRRIRYYPQENRGLIDALISWLAWMLMIFPCLVVCSGRWISSRRIRVSGW